MQNKTAGESFFYAGTVVDEQARPIAGVEVVATHHAVDGQFYGYIATAQSDARGHFLIDRAVAMSGAPPVAVTAHTIRLAFQHRDYAFARLEDLHVFGRQAATRLSITLRKGRALGGSVVDAQHRPISGALVEIKFGDLHDLRRGTVTDAAGRFEFRGLPALAGRLSVLTVEPNQPMLTVSRNIDDAKTDAGEIALSPIELPPGLVVREWLGMQLIDANAALQAAFHLQCPDGVLVLDPGTGSERLKIGKLQRGDQFWIVGETPVKNWEEFKRSLLAAERSPDGKTRVRMVYHFTRPDFAGTNTQHLELSETDRAAL